MQRDVRGVAWNREECLTMNLIQIERELNAANTQIGLLIAGSKQQERQIKFLKETIHRLVKAGDKLGPHGNGHCECVGGSFAACDHCRYAEEWTKAKEGL